MTGLARGAVGLERLPRDACRFLTTRGRVSGAANGPRAEGVSKVLILVQDHAAFRKTLLLALVPFDVRHARTILLDDPAV